jgi:hypothetical protein
MKHLGILATTPEGPRCATEPQRATRNQRFVVRLVAGPVEVRHVPDLTHILPRDPDSAPTPRWTLTCWRGLRSGSPQTSKGKETTRAGLNSEAGRQIKAVPRPIGPVPD